MNFQEFKTFREEVIEQISPLRLDCMNPFKAMDFLKGAPLDTASHSVNTTLDTWASTMNVHHYRDRAIASQGVRESLKALFPIFANDNKELWLPEDIYPFYWDTAHKTGISTHSFPTLPDIDLTPLNRSSKNSVVVITNPLSPSGRFLKKQEIEQIKNWLEGSTDRQIIIDTVYSYSSSFDAHTIELFETGQCFIAHSLSKAWIERGVFGVLLPPEINHNLCKSIIQQPSEKSCSLALSALTKRPDLPTRQQERFSREWKRLTPFIQKFAPQFTPPSTGYFTVVEAHHEKILEESQALAIPASVFGSTNPQLSVVSCLYNINNKSN